MSLPHFFVETLRPGKLTLSAADTRHAVRSLRLRRGNPLTLADGNGSLAEARLAEDTGDRAVVEVGPVRHVDRETPFVSVALAPPKGDRLSWAVQKLAEIGVDEIVLLRTEHSIRTWESDRAERAAERLQAVAREAAMQSRRPFLTSVAGPVTLVDAVRAEGPKIALWEGASRGLASFPAGTPQALRIMVGPEGGFSVAEVQTLQESGASLASLGRGILRTETAAVVGAALVLARYGRLG